MKPLRAALALALALALPAAGCDGIFDVTKVTKGPPDASPDAPPDATDGTFDPCAPMATFSGSIHFDGKMLDTVDSSPLVGLSVDLDPGGVATTDATGVFAIDSAPTQTPLRASFTGSGLASYPFHRIYYQRPFAATPSDVSSKLFKDTTVDSLYTGSSVTRDPSKATAFISINDCTGNGVANATLTVAGATVVYQGANQFTNGTGGAYALFIPPGPVQIQSSVAAPFTVTANASDMLLVYLIVP